MFVITQFFFTGEVLIMTKEDEIPDWAGAQDFYEKYDPKEILGRYCHIVRTLQ